MEDITPLFIYISSCEKYYRENGHGKIDRIFSALISESYGELDFVTSYAHDSLPGEVILHRMSRVKRGANKFFLREGYCKRFIKPFGIVFRGGFNHFRTEEEELQLEVEAREAEEAYYRQEAFFIEQGYYRGSGYVEEEEEYEESEDNGRREEFPINDSKTFKEDQCVICLEEEPKVLFCNCGHLCICEKCLVCRFDNCPVCKKENTILRIIE